MVLAAIALASAGAVTFSVATGSIHEAAASILIVGAAACTGIAGISRDMTRRKKLPPTLERDAA